MYFVKSNFLLRNLYPNRVWKKNTEGEKVLYLTFDDGPHETATPFALHTLRGFQAKATFFCIGKNVEQHPTIFQQILDEGHSVGNHTFNHLNGWKTDAKTYLENIGQTEKIISTQLFRPPYGRMTKQEEKIFLQQYRQHQIIMWDVLSGDFDTKISGEKCWNNILKNAESGSVIVFHDSAKAFDRMKIALPKTLEYFSEKGFRFEKL
ncbi:polysaccharide deacetylase [Arachidicoccus ginsenosidimutans]|uniref:polysaccharide deacetylase family protein n=1 Tax=Arachidicoccus sp. BS20 TaxID=1850526 RepID=UPI0007F122B1|nr:polysaccharide deacetylase family protein [Arachidicoccus sp. BS20]ANI89830.1 polysaccharide deacetylase [Arachidicoccus sp. BS20]